MDKNFDDLMPEFGNQQQAVRKFEFLLSCTKCESQFREVMSLEAIAELRCSKCEQLLCKAVPIAGVLYVLSNPSMPGIVKIGRTKLSISDRLRELSISSDIPTPYVREALFSSSDPARDEGKVHKRLSGFRILETGNFFRLAADEAVDAIRIVLGRSPFEGPFDGADSFEKLWKPHH